MIASTETPGTDWSLFLSSPRISPAEVTAMSRQGQNAAMRIKVLSPWSPVSVSGSRLKTHFLCPIHPFYEYCAWWAYAPGVFLFITDGLFKVYGEFPPRLCSNRGSLLSCRFLLIALHNFFSPPPLWRRFARGRGCRNYRLFSDFQKGPDKFFWVDLMSVNDPVALAEAQTSKGYGSWK